MKEQIQALQDYFKTKLIRGEYKLLRSDSKYLAFLLIDDEYKFSIWVHENNAFQQFVSTAENFIQLPEFTKDEANAALFHLMPRRLEMIKTVELQEKELQLLELQKSINQIKTL